MSGVKWSKSRRKARSLAYKLMYVKHPEYKKKIDVGVTKFWKENPGIKKIYSKLKKKFWTKKERVKQSRRKKLLYKKNPKLMWLIANKLRQRFKAHPYLIKRLNKAKQEYYEKNPKARKRLLEYLSKSQAKIPAMNHIFVKSQGEKKIHNVLFENNILPNYESVELNFPEMDPIPDFFPVGKCKYGIIKNVFIEFYGGHPKSWPNKVRKNKLYKKYKTPVLVLTPYELKKWNFKDYLLSSLVRLSNSSIARNFNLKKWEL